MRQLEPRSQLETGWREILTTLFRRKWTVIGVFVVTTIVVVLPTFMEQDIYQSDAKLLVRIGRESIPFEAALLGPVVGVGQSLQSKVQSQMQILTSHHLAEQVVDELTPARLLATDDLQLLQETPPPDTETPQGIYERERLRALAVEKFISNLRANVGEDSNIIEVSYRARNPQLAQEVLQKLIPVFLEYTIDVHASQLSPDFFREQVMDVWLQLEAKEKQLQKYRTAHGLGADIIAMERSELNRLADLETERAQALANMRATRARLDSLQQATASMSSTRELTITTGLQNLTADEFKLKRMEIRQRLAEVVSRYQDNHRFVIELKKQLEMLDAALAHETDTRTSVQSGLNLTFERLLQETELERARYHASAAKLQTLEEEIDDHKAGLGERMQHVIFATRLEKEVQLLYDEYTEYRKNLLRVEINKQLDLEKVSNVSVVEPATRPFQPVPSNKKSKIILGMLMGLLAGVGLAFLQDYLDDALKSANEVEQRLGVPILATLVEEER